jgi:hypothetical protein
VTPDIAIAEFEISSGAQRGSRLSLYANRLVHQAGESMETVSLEHLASVRVSFERDQRKLNWAIGLLVSAVVLALISAPLRSGIGAAASRVGDPARRESLDALLYGVFNALGAMAGVLPGIAAALAVAAVALLVYFWLGATELSFAFAATERGYTVPGRNRPMVDFAHAVADQISARPGQ